MDYWNDIYWKKNLESHATEELDFMSDLWCDKYLDVVSTIKGDVLDLGCGMGQYTKYFKDKGMNVVSSDISSLVLEKLKENIPDVNVLEMDMSNKFPFADNSFDLVFANLSIHYFDLETTKNILVEIKRILKDGGYFIGSVNSAKVFKYIESRAIEIEKNYYQDGDRKVRLWDEGQFDYFFKDYILVSLNEVTTTRWNKEKVMWEFIYRVQK